MSFLRNIRNSISRGNSSTRDSTPNSRRSSSVDSTPNRCDSLEPKPADGLQRSETFTLDDDESLIAAKVKSSTKEKVLSKFSTFTKRKKSPAPSANIEEIESTTYYKWRSGIVADPAEAAMDPFNFLYEQPSSLKSDLSGHSDSGSRKAPPSASAPTDYSTYRKNRVPSHLREKLDQLKNHPEISEEIENDPDKFRTITLNTFRKSFRDKFLAAQNEVPHNPSWFVEVEPPPEGAKASGGNSRDEGRRDVFVFDNENYRPTSRSPVRNRTPLRIRPPLHYESPIRGELPASAASQAVRATARSAVKRTDTFKVERPLAEPSIRIEIKNSITPNQPGRIVPVGVAKPMPSQIPYQPLRHNRYVSPASGWKQSPSSGGKQSENHKSGRYQTCIRITSNDPVVKKEPTRVQISGNARSPLRYITPRQSNIPKKQTYFGDNIPREIHPHVKSRQYIQHPSEIYSYSRSSRPTSGFINRNDDSRSSMTQAVPRRSRSPNKAPWR